MDSIDRQIINLLKADARMSAAEIGRIVCRSRTAVSQRIEALQASGQIAGFSIITPAPPISLLLEVRFRQQGMCDEAVAHFKKKFALERAWSVAGDTDLFIFAGAHSIDEANQMKDWLNQAPQVLRVTTHTVLKTYR
ncbi:MAG: Lrp/AsnC family transcriptional regulator [Lautropia sp.]|nr:Lrp/AsnC family transcriptional regulator [Lautropia sp.]